MAEPHRFAVTVYYEDTDMGGIVYHANYLKFIERARSALVRERGLDQNAMRDAGTVFVVRRIDAEFLGPARLDDALEVRTEIASATGARLSLVQTVARGVEDLFRARVEIVAADPARGRPRRLPPELRAPG